MLLMREVFHCKPGKVKKMVEKFVAMSGIMERSGQGKMRIMTDLAGAQYWTVVAEFELESLADFEKMMSGQDQSMSKDDQDKMNEIMKDYHDLVEYGRREIYKLEN
jgi:hypothetical protein